MVSCDAPSVGSSLEKAGSRGFNASPEDDDEEEVFSSIGSSSPLASIEVRRCNERTPFP